MLGFLRPTVYVQLHPDRLSVRDVSKGRTLAGPPIVAVSDEVPLRVIEVGEAAMTATGRTPLRIVNPFKHPRSLVSDFALGEAVLRGFVRRALAGRWMTVPPVMVLHPKVDPEGGFTQIEIRALREMAAGAGASLALLWQGRELLHRELLALELPSGGSVLE